MEKLISVSLPQFHWEQIMRALPRDGDEGPKPYWTIQTKAEIERALFLASKPISTPRAVPDNWTDPTLSAPAPEPEIVMELVYVDEPWWVCPKDQSRWSQTSRDKSIGYCPYCKTLLLPERKSA